MRDLNTRDWDLNQVQPGMEVCDRNGVKVGAVAHVYRDPVLEAESAVGQESASKRMVEVKTGLLGLGKHLFVPMNGIQAVTSESVVLSRSREEFDQMGWASRPASLAEPHQPGPMQRGACGVGACLAQPFTVRQLAIAVLLAVTRVRIVSLREAGQRPTEIRLGRRPQAVLCRLQRADPGVSDWRKLGTVYGPPVVRLDSEHGIEVRGEAEVR